MFEIAAASAAWNESLSFAASDFGNLLPVREPEAVHKRVGGEDHPSVFEIGFRDDGTGEHEKALIGASSIPAIVAGDLEDLRREVGRIKWWHSIDLGNGVVTPGRVQNLETLQRIGLPERLEGKSVLDIGAWDGFYSFEAERRGAARVLATDSFSWGGGGWGTKAGFTLARKALGSRIEDLYIDVLDLSPDRVGTFDVVLCLGVLYHVRHPLLMLERVFSVTGGQLILETHVDLLWTRRPAIAFYPNDELHRDPTNWCGPNPRAVEAMLRTVGFRRVAKISESPSRLHRLAYAPLDARRTGAPILAQAQRTRMVFHAWR